MKTVELSQKRIEEIVLQSSCISDCIVNLYLEVLKAEWDDIEFIEVWPQCNRTTALFIIDQMKTRWDAVSSGLMWMNKGFSSSSDTAGDFQVIIPDNCFTLKQVKSVDHSTIVDMTASYAQQEIEEMSRDFNDSRDE